MINLEELEKCAKTVLNHKPHQRKPGGGLTFQQMEDNMRPYYEFEDAANPETILKLIERDKRQVSALKFAEMMIEHAIALDYLGEGSTRGMANDALDKIREALKE